MTRRALASGKIGTDTRAKARRIGRQLDVEPGNRRRDGEKRDRGDHGRKRMHVTHHRLHQTARTRVVSTTLRM
jgi:hypothetical protein